MRFRILRGYTAEARRNLEAALRSPELAGPSAARAHALYTEAVLASSQGEHATATHLLHECLLLRRRLDNAVDIAGTLSTLAVTHLQEGDLSHARECEEEALEIFERIGERTGVGVSTLHLGEIALEAGEPVEARRWLERCLTLARDIGHQELEAESERDLGALAFAADSSARALAHLERSLTICRNAEDRRNEAQALHWLGKLDIRSGNWSRAREHLSEALGTFRRYEMNAELLACLDDHAALLARMGRRDAARQVQGATTSLRHRLRLPRSRRDQPTAGAQPAAASAAPPMQEGRFSLDEAIALARNALDALRDSRAAKSGARAPTRDFSHLRQRE